MSAVPSAVLIPEVFEFLQLHCLRGMLAPGKGIGVTNVAAKLHEVGDSLVSLRIEEALNPPSFFRIMVMNLNPGMKVSSPQLRSKQSMSEVSPIITVPTVDGFETVVFEEAWKKVTTDEGSVEVLWSPNHVDLLERGFVGPLFLCHAVVIHNGFLPFGHV